MKAIRLSLAHYDAIQKQQGSAAAVEAMAAYIEDHSTYPVRLEMRGPNREGEMVASLSFVRAASLEPSSFGPITPNLLSCGFSHYDDQAIQNLFDMLTDERVEGLVVGSFAKPSAFVTFER